ncbi:MAG: hypothetical protein BGP13_11425 [Sphingobacteriales bacterium 40-81]|nr:MAG: hypothetical protein BGP13_11425 [Sphingobacteriales bacterium 40-81]
MSKNNFFILLILVGAVGCHYTQRTGIAAGKGFYNCQPSGTAAWFCFIDEVKNFSRALVVEPELLLIVA